MVDLWDTDLQNAKALIRSANECANIYTSQTDKAETLKCLTIIRAKVASLKRTINNLEMSLLDMDSSNLSSQVIHNRRRDLDEVIYSFRSLELILKNSNPDLTHIQPNSTRLNESDLREMSTSEFKYYRDTMIKIQDDELDLLDSSASSIKNISTNIRDEVNLHTRLLGDVSESMDYTNSFVNRNRERFNNIILRDSKALIKSLQQKNNKKKPKNLNTEPQEEEAVDNSSVDDEIQREESLDELTTEDLLEPEPSVNSNVLPENYNFSEPPAKSAPTTSDTVNVNLHTVEYKQPEYKSVLVERDGEVDLRRRKLPCCMMEQEIIDAIRNNDIVLITGDTGTGKSTQIPQFLYENGFCGGESIIGVTQTRRVACIAIAKQISLELNSSTLVGYQIRYDKMFNRNCKIKLMTDGILLNHLKSDILLTGFSVIIIDEAHERRVNSDILIGLLSQIVKLRRQLYNQHNKLPLKYFLPTTHFHTFHIIYTILHYLTLFTLFYTILHNFTLFTQFLHINLICRLVIMSATIRKEDFLENEIFRGIKHVHITSGKLNYTVHYNKTTPVDYLLEAKKKILQIHKKLPQGSILVFLTGKHELYTLKSLLSGVNTGYIPPQETAHNTTENSNTTGDPVDGEIFELEDESEDLEVDLGELDDKTLGSDEQHSDTDERIEYELNVLTENYKKSVDCEWLGSDSQGKLTIKILHASQSNQQQMECFMLPKENERIVILSTNVAETSITLPNIRYVVDSGKEKRKKYDNVRGFEKFEILNVSKASADQRAGRCGRLGHGHCYRLYTNSIFNNLFPPSSPVEILESNLTSVCLVLISFGINPYNFTFLTRPPKELIDSAILTLYHLDIIKLTIRGGTEENLNLLGDPFKVPPEQHCTPSIDRVDELTITRLGKCVSLIPLDPRYAKMIYCVLSKLNHIKESIRPNFLSVSFIVISALSHNNTLFTHDSGDISSGKYANDVEMLMCVLCDYSVSEEKNAFSSRNSPNQKLNSLNQKLISEVFLQANQLFEIISAQFNSLKHISQLNVLNSKLQKLKNLEMKILVECVIECLVDKIAVGVRYLTPDSKSKGYKCAQMPNETVYLKNSKHNYEIVAYNYLMSQPTHSVTVNTAVTNTGTGNTAVTNTGTGNTAVSNTVTANTARTNTGDTIKDDKIRMYNVVEVNAAHLAMLSSSLIVSKEVEKSPKPVYADGKVFAYAKQYYKPLDYPLTISKIQLNSHPLVFRAFAEAFCFGLVYAKLAEFTPLLTCASEDFYKPLKLNSALYNFIKSIASRSVCDRETFEREFSRDNKFLFKQYTNLLRRQYEPKKLLSIYQSLLIYYTIGNLRICGKIGNLRICGKIGNFENLCKNR
ncbi:Helicase conserved domain protein [Theileria parva strain Muguga]|uniref:Helicase conserved domain protein n=1 Tax=Theileria parva strain Muguga TaxID=333668 RepID=UPI001C61E939|nr:Helicase conserved domain protein [Theileria parva strain Muguga]EAN33936.2 Helicase conserved domain protein [Theileria parva strain Muguga]